MPGAVIRIFAHWRTHYAGDAMIICPPLVISHSEIDELVDKAKLCLDLTLEEIHS